MSDIDLKCYLDLGLSNAFVRLNIYIALQQTTNNKQQTTNNKQQTTNNKQQTNTTDDHNSPARILLESSG